MIADILAALLAVLFVGCVPVGADQREPDKLPREIPSLKVSYDSTKFVSLTTSTNDTGLTVWTHGCKPAVAKFDSNYHIIMVNGVDMREFLKLAKELSPKPHNPFPQIAGTTLEMRPIKSEAQVLRELAKAAEKREKDVTRLWDILAKIEEVVR